MSEHLLTSRSRNLGYGWSNQPSGNGPLAICKPAAPDASGGLRAVENEITRATRFNSGNFRSGQLFVAGKPVIARWGAYEDQTGWHQGWVSLDRGFLVNELLAELRDGGAVRVRTRDD
jgi:hypothetical protein